MMKIFYPDAEQIDLKHAAGKVVQAVVFGCSDEHVLITFTDGTFGSLRVDGYEDERYIECEEVFDARDFLAYSEPDPYRSLEAAFGDRGKAMIDAMKEEDARLSESNQQRREANERAEYERLKAKYEDTPCES